MVNHWTEKKNRNHRLEEAQHALQKWCNKIAYDDFGMYRSGFVMNWDKPMNARRKFFEEHPEYQEFEMDLRITWNMHHEGGHPSRNSINAVSDPTWPNDASGIPEVSYYPDDWWKECAEIARRAKGNYCDHKETKTYNNGKSTYQAWVGDKIAKARTKRTHQIYLRANNIYDESVDAEKHMHDRVVKFWDNMTKDWPVWDGEDY